jgi:hypothetical protein
MSPVLEPVVTSVFMLCSQHVNKQESNSENKNRGFKSRRIMSIIRSMGEEVQLSVKNLVRNPEIKT